MAPTQKGHVPPAFHVPRTGTLSPQRLVGADFNVLARGIKGHLLPCASTPLPTSTCGVPLPLALGSWLSLALLLGSDRTTLSQALPSCSPLPRKRVLGQGPSSGSHRLLGGGQGCCHPRLSLPPCISLPLDRDLVSAETLVSQGCCRPWLPLLRLALRFPHRGTTSRGRQSLLSRLFLASGSSRYCSLINGGSPPCS